MQRSTIGQVTGGWRGPTPAASADDYFRSEDIGNADPRALSVATSGLAGFQAVGMPEGRIVLGQVCTYLSLAPKSNASYLAIDRALDCVRRNGSAAVPAPLRSAATVLRKELGDGVGYVYPHDHRGWVKAEYRKR